MKLYYMPGASSLSPHIVLREVGVVPELVRVDGKTRKLPDGSDYSAVNPKGYVPALELDSGERLTEGAAIVQYLADLHPDAGLAPPNGTMARYRLQEWLNFVATELHKAHAPLLDPRVPSETKEANRNRIKGRYDWLSSVLKHRPWLMGEDFGVADIHLYVVLSWSRWVNIDLSEWGVLSDYAARISARPAVQEASKAEGLAR